MEKSVCPLGHRTIDIEDSTDLMDGGSSSDGEVSLCHNHPLVPPPDFFFK